MFLYREYIMQVLGYTIPPARTAEVMLELAKRIKAPAFEAEHGWRTDPPFPGSTPGPELIGGSIWRLVCACRLLNAADNTEIGVLYTTLAGDRQPAVVPNPAGTFIPEEYKPLASL
jgi:hypothetical protein